MRVSVIGAGAIGSVVASYLSDFHEVSLIAKIFQVDDISGEGIIIEGVRGKTKFKVKAKTLVDKDQDLVIICTKTQDLEQVIKDNLDVLTNTLVMTSQNGIRADEIAAGLLPKENLLSSIVMFGATLLKPAHAVHNFEGDWVVGSFFEESKEKIPLVQEILSDCFRVAVSPDIKSMKWTKVFVNFNNCLPALLGKSMQEAFSDIEICKISIKLLSEGLSAVDKAGIKLTSLPDFEVERLRGLISMSLEQAANIFSGIMRNLSKEPLYGSILQSIKRGRPSEIDFINGEIVRLGKEKNIATPLNEKIVQMVKNVEKTKKFLTPEEVVVGAAN